MLVWVILACYSATLAFALWEAGYDNKLDALFKRDNKLDKLEDMMLHSYQLVPRGIVIALAALWSATYAGALWDFWLYGLSYTFWYWLTFDILYNLHVELTPWYYVGTTATVDKFLHKLRLDGRVLVILKLIGVIVFMIWT